LAGLAGSANTGGGGGAGSGGASGGPTTGGAGGSGVIIIKYPDTFTATFSGGVTQSTAAPSAGFKVSTITAAGVADTVSFA
jgi:hypothetical protein